MFFLVSKMKNSFSFVIMKNNFKVSISNNSINYIPSPFFMKNPSRESSVGSNG